MNKKILTNNVIIILSIVFIILLLSLSVSAQIVVQRCDNTSEWESNTSLSVDNSDKKEGNGCIVTNAVAGTCTWFKKKFSQIKTGIDESGYLTFWLYVSDASKLNGGQVEISSSGGPDNEEYNWPLNKDNVSDGWNYLTLQISSALTTGGQAKLDSINFFRIYQNLSGPITVKLDFIRFRDMLQDPVSGPHLNVPVVDNSTLDGKVMFGYQGWFGHPDDGSSVNSFSHWGSLNEPFDLSIDMYPDLREYGSDEKYETDLTFEDGSMAPVFSSYNRNTVIRHMKWVRDYNTDGVFLERFSDILAHRDTVTVSVIKGCEQYGRVFAIMYDGIANRVEEIKNDWMHLVDDLKVTASDRYLHHRGRPLVALWGYTVREDATIDQLEELTNWFHTDAAPQYRASIFLGVNNNFLTRILWLDAFKNVEVLSPWMVGRFVDTIGFNANKNILLAEQAWCDQNNVDYMPVIWPGFSWYNLLDGPKNAIPRDGGNLYWHQAHNVISLGVKSIYIAMFDEVNESTAMFKTAENESMTPAQEYWLDLNDDGYDLPSDWYLRAADLTAQVLRGHEENRSTLDTPPEGIMTIRPTDELAGNGQGAMEFIFPDFPDETTIEISIDSGMTYIHSLDDNAGSYTIDSISSGAYRVFVRHGEGSPAVDMGNVTIANSYEGLPPAPAADPDPADGAIGVSVFTFLSWTEGDNAQSHDVCFGTSNPPDSVANQSGTKFNPGLLSTSTTYYWRINEVNIHGTTTGTVWSFTTADTCGGDVVLDDCDSYDDWQSQSPLGVDTIEKKEGSASLKAEGSGTVWFNKTFSLPVNSYVNEGNGYLDLWLYVSDISQFNGGGQIEITSAGRADVDEYSWSMGSLNLTNGWNNLHLKISNAGKTPGDANPDLSAINYFRIYQFLSGPIIVRIDDIRFSGISTSSYIFTQQGWYMISLPVIPEDSSVSTLFPTALGSMAFGWDPIGSVYDVETEIEPRYGYWIAMPDATTDQVCGMPLEDYTIHCDNQGWYMIGSVLGSTDFTNPDDDPDGQVFSPAFGWDAGTRTYYQTTTLEEKNGYWAAVFGECDLTVGGGGGGLPRPLSQSDWNAFSKVHGSQPPGPPDMEWTTGEMVQVPMTYGLSQNTPNPFNPETTIEYQLPENGHVSLIVYNMIGQEVTRLIDNHMEAGYHEVVWDGRSELGSRVSSGVYIVMLKAGEYSQTRKLLLVQ